MSVRAFLCAAYALLVETWEKLSPDLLTAINTVNKTIGLPSTDEPDGDVPSPADNQAALAALEKMVPR